MISLKRYLEGPDCATAATDSAAPYPCASLLAAYRDGLAEMASCCAIACTGVGPELKSALMVIDEKLGERPNPSAAITAKGELREALQSWGKKTARHYEQKAAEIKDLLLVMARTAESLGHKDEEYTQQMDLVTRQLESISSLEDITQIRASVVESAVRLKSSVARMSAESKAVIEHLRAEVFTYDAKLQKAERIASCDALTGLGSRLWVEGKIQQRVDKRLPFAVVMIDVDDFRRVNQEYGNLVGDLILKEFARELRASCKVSDLVARWGGDKFIVVSDVVGLELEGQLTRLRSWICRPYLVPGRAGHVSVRLDSSMAVSEFREGDGLRALLERVDADLCAQQESRPKKLRA